MGGSTGLVMTTAGVRRVAFAAPCEVFRRLVEAGDGIYTRELSAWIGPEPQEAVATVLLLAADDPKTMSIMAQVAGRQVDGVMGTFGAGYAGFAVRIFRLVRAVWGRPWIDDGKLLKLGTDRKISGEIDRALRIGKRFVSNQSAPDRALTKLLAYLPELSRKILFLELLEPVKKRVRAQIVETLADDVVEALGAGFPAARPDCFHDLLVAAHAFLDDSAARKLAATFGLLDDIRLRAALRLLRDSADLGVVRSQVSIVLELVHCPIDLDGVCNLLAQKKYWEGIIMLSTASAKAKDFYRAALNWYRNGRRADDVLGRSAFDRSHLCYCPIFRNLDRCRPFLATVKDELFELILCDHLCNARPANWKSILIDLDFPSLEGWLEAHAKQQLWKWYRRQRQYTKAAVSLLGHIAEYSLPKQLRKLDRVIAMSFESPSLKTSAVRLRCAVEVQIEITQGSETARLEVRALFQSCVALKRWDLVLRLLAGAGLDAPDKTAVISTAWVNFLYADSRNLSAAIPSLVRRIGIVNVNLREFVHILEDFRMNRRGNWQWGVAVLLTAGFGVTELLEVYCEDLEREDLIVRTKREFIAVVSLLVSKGGKCDSAKYRGWFVENARREPYFDAVMQFL
jgi:hypothetical protein